MGRDDGEGESTGKAGDKAKKLDTSFKKAIGGSLKLKGVEFKGCVCSPPHDLPSLRGPEYSLLGWGGEEPCLCGVLSCVLVLVLVLVGAW